MWNSDNMVKLVWQYGQYYDILKIAYAILGAIFGTTFSTC